MTTNYNLEILLKQAHFKLTYKFGKFKKLEYLKGALDADTLNHIGKIIPFKETDLNDFKITFKHRVNYTLIVKDKSLYTQFLQEWFAFYNKLMGFDPRFNATEGRCLKSIIKYLTEISTDNNEPLMLWQIILQNWHTLPDFYRNSADLKFISSQINKILIHVKGTNNKNESVFKSALESETGRGFKFK